MLSKRISPFDAHHVAVKQLQGDVHSKIQVFHMQIRAKPIISAQPGDKHAKRQVSIARSYIVVSSIKLNVY